jgi:acetyl-CoA carboxylase biotin carboxyl carrier protein|tara:strand:- start:1954 stop:2112 length:159 start_codon:yes stop_codon:yes gene_type:complete
MDIRKIKTLIEMLEESNLKEIEVSQGDESVRISKQSNDIKIAKDNNSQDSSD